MKTPSEITCCLVRVAEIVRQEMGDEWGIWQQEVRLRGREKMKYWVSANHWDFNMWLRNLFFYNGSPYFDEMTAFHGECPDGISTYLCEWLVWLTLEEKEPSDGVDEFLATQGLPRNRFGGVRLHPQELTCGADAEL